jgi:hypothetical protein
MKFIALAVAATMGLASVSVFAQDHHRGDNRGAGAWQHQGANQGRRDSAYNNGYARDYGRSYGNRRDDGNVVGALVLGALAGTLLGQANAYNYSPPPTTYYAPQYYNSPASGYYTPPPAVYYNPGYGYYGN